MTSRVPELAAYINAHPQLSIDVGQVVFGDATALTGDTPVGYYLHRVYGRKWFTRRYRTAKPAAASCRSNTRNASLCTHCNGR